MKALYRQMALPVPKLLCDTCDQFHSHCGKELIWLRRDRSVLIYPFWQERLHKIYWKIMFINAGIRSHFYFLYLHTSTEDT